MLNAKRVKEHGMQSRRWTIKDKVLQYKGLLNLYKRDRKIIDLDKIVNQKKQDVMLVELQKRIYNYRGELDNAIRGDRQALRNVLQEHRELQLAFQDLHPTKVVEKMTQTNFNKQKELDRLRYKMKIKSQQLIDLKLELAYLQDLLKMETEAVCNPIKEEQQAQIITGKVQDAILKEEAAIVIKNTYKSILNIMKQDAIFFDAVLDTLKQDGINQGRCMHRTIELGQLATEYLDDRTQEFLMLERRIKANMIIRGEDLEKIHQKASNLSKSLKNLLRRESDIVVFPHQLKRYGSVADLQEESLHFEEILNQLKNSLMVPGFDSLFPCFETQRNQAIRLKDYAEDLTKKRDFILNKFTHTKKMQSTLMYTMVDNTLEYRQLKKELIEGANVENNKHHITEEMIEKRGKLVTSIRKTLQQIHQLLKHVYDPNDKSFGRTVVMYGSNSTVAQTVPTDGKILIAIIKQKLQILVSQVQIEQLSEKHRFNVIDNYSKFVHMYTRSVDPLKKKQYESLVEFQFDDSKVPTREAIKEQAREIVKECTKQLHEEEVAKPPRKKKRKW